MFMWKCCALPQPIKPPTGPSILTLFSPSDPLHFPPLAQVLEGGQELKWGDYIGNMMFNTLGGHGAAQLGWPAGSAIAQLHAASLLNTLFLSPTLPYSSPARFTPQKTKELPAESP